MKLVLFFIFSTLAHSANDWSLANAICNQVIPFANQHGSEVSETDLYHCHTVLELKSGEEKSYSNHRTWEGLEARKWGLVCHGHEKDGKRIRDRENDNFNIFYKDGLTSFWGERYPIREKDVLQRYALPESRYLVTWTNIYFYPSHSAYCPLLRDAFIKTCGGMEICIGLESDDHN